MLQVRAVTGKFAESSGSPLMWRQDMDLSGLNIMTLGIYYEALQRRTPPLRVPSRSSLALAV